MRAFWTGLLGATALTMTSLCGAASAAEISPAVVYDVGGKFDKSFNEAAYNGAEAYKTKTGTAYRDFEVQQDAQREQALRRFARDGASPIVAIGFSQAASLETVAKEFPDTKFAIVDAVVDLPNVRSILFSEEQGSYLVGVLAAMKSQSGKVGFVGGMDIPLIRNFACGYKGGVKSVKADAAVIENMTGTTGAAWNDPVRGGELAKSQLDQGADVVFHAAGGTGIGVDSHQNGLHPGHVLTSMVKRVDTAVEKAFEDAAADKWTSGKQVLGLAEDGVGYAMDDNNASLVTPEMKAAADKAKADIIAGTVKVHSYYADNACPY